MIPIERAATEKKKEHLEIILTEARYLASIQRKHAYNTEAQFISSDAC
jgi:hypothetical protein